MERIKELLIYKHKGFSGITHWLIAICLFLCMWLIPWDFTQNYIAAISANTLFGIIIFLTIGGASLLPDLDSSPLQEGGSTAVYQLGFLGYGLSVIFITISGVFYTLLHTKYDEKPKSQHRMLFHAPIIAVLIFVFAWFIIPNSEETLSANISFSNAHLILFLAIAAICIYLGSCMTLFKVFSLIKKSSWTQFVSLGAMVGSVIYMLNLPFSQLRLIGIAVALGYLFHIIGDFFSKGSAPIFFPIPVPSKLTFNFKNMKLQFWKKPYLFGGKFNITTGGAVNIILNVALAIADVALFYYIFFAK